MLDFKAIGDGKTNDSQVVHPWMCKSVKANIPFYLHLKRATKNGKEEGKKKKKKGITQCFVR